MRQKTKYGIPSNFEDQFRKSILTFKFQTIYCPIREKICHFNDIDASEFNNLLTDDECSGEQELAFLGP